MSLITFIIVISVLVFVHELGHFLFAKWNGIRVDEFAIGFPPKIYSWKKGETTYSLNLVPFGGYVKIFGENPDDDSISGQDKSRSFINKPRHIQAAVLVAGILFNIIFAWILFSGSYMLGVARESSEVTAPVYVTNVVKDSPAMNAGLKVGDLVVGASIAGEDNLEVVTPESIRKYISESEGQEIIFEISKDGNIREVKIKASSEIIKGSFAVGIEMAQITTLKLSFFEAIWKGFTTTLLVIKETTVGISTLLAKIVTLQADFSGVAGPVGIVSLVGQASLFGFGYLLSFTALISINLAIINLVPFPALDGGRLLIVGIEAIRRKMISPKITNTLNLIGFALLMIFMIAITFSDIKRLFN